MPIIEEYDLTTMEGIRRLLDVSRPNVIIKLAAHVGRIGANLELPAEFFYDKLMTGTQLMHNAWNQGVYKYVAIGTVCAYQKFIPNPFMEEKL